MAVSPWLDPANPDDLELIETVWPDAPTGDEPGETAALDLYLGAAQQQCLAYLDLPVPEGETDPEMPDTIPENWRMALLLQARALWQLSVTNPAGEIGQDGFSTTPFPMDWNVKNLLKPASSKVRVR